MVQSPKGILCEIARDFNPVRRMDIGDVRHRMEISTHAGKTHGNKLTVLGYTKPSMEGCGCFQSPKGIL